MDIFTAVPEDIEDILADLRPEDREEWEAAMELWPTPKYSGIKEALAYSIATANVAKVLSDRNGDPMLMFGVNHQGWAWLVATRRAQEQGRACQRVFAEAVETLHEHSPLEGKALACVAYYKNTLHHIWLMRLGFRMVDPRLAEGVIGKAPGFITYIRERGAAPCASV